MFQFVGKGVPADVSGEDTEQGSHESGGDGVSEFVNIGEVAQCRNQADDGAEHAEGGGIHTALGKDRGSRAVAFFHLFDFGINYAADKFAVESVGNHGHGRTDERVFNFIGTFFNSHDAF